jgi:hypothetical protein
MRALIIAMCRNWIAYMTRDTHPASAPDGVPSASLNCPGSPHAMKAAADGKEMRRFRFTRQRKENLLFDTEDGGHDGVCLCMSAAATRTRRGL